MRPAAAATITLLFTSARGRRQCEVPAQWCLSYAQMAMSMGASSVTLWPREYGDLALHARWTWNERTVCRCGQPVPPALPGEDPYLCSLDCALAADAAGGPSFDPARLPATRERVRDQVRQVVAGAALSPRRRRRRRRRPPPAGRISFSVDEYAQMVGRNPTAVRRDIERKACDAGGGARSALLALGIVAHKGAADGRWSIIVPRAIREAL